MNNPALIAFASVVLVMAAFPGHAAPRVDDPLAIYRGKARVLVVLAADPTDAKLRRQKELYADMKAGAEQRDLALVEALGSSAEATALRRTFGLGEGFQAMLVGKDGGEKLTSTDPLGPAELFPLIDSMPMRQDEMRKR